jgi:ribosomal protein L7/L12
LADEQGERGMAVADMNCPNCGASVDFAGGTRATCSFCKSQLYLTGDGVKAASVLDDLLENQPAARSVDIDRIQQLLRDGKKIDAIKLVREQTDLGLKEAKDAVEAIERGETLELKPRAATAPRGATGVDLDEINELLLQDKKIEAIKLYREQTGVGLKEAKDTIEAIEATGRPPLPNPPGQTVTSTTYRPPRQSASTLGCLFGCLPTLLFIGLCAGLIMLSSHVMFRAFGPLDQALTIVNSDPAVRQAFGGPITPGIFVTGEMESGGSSSSAQLNVPIYGPKRSGELNVSGEWRRGVWDLDIWVVYDEDGEEQTIYITRQVK